MSEYRPISRTAYCAEDHWRATIEVIDGSDRRQVEADVDVNPGDGTANPRIQIAQGLWVDVDQNFVSAFRALPGATTSAEAQATVCRASLLQPTYPLRITGSVETTGIISAAGGSSHPAVFAPFLPNDSIYPNASLTTEWRPVNGVLGVFEFIAGPTAFATQPAGAPYGGAPNSVPIDFPQAYIQVNAGLFCALFGRRYERLGPPVDAVRADLRMFQLPSVGFGMSPFGESVLEAGLCSDVVDLRAFVSRGPDRHWTDNNTSPYGGIDLSLNFGSWSLASHAQVGPDQDGDNQDLRHTEDLAVTIGAPTDTAQFSAYSLVGFEQRPGSGGLWQPWGTGYGFLRVHPQGSYVGGVFRGGYAYVPPLRSGLPAAVGVGQFSGGMIVYPFRTDVFQIRGMFDLIAAVDGSRPFDGGAFIPQFMLTMLVVDSVNLGSPRLP